MNRITRGSGIAWHYRGIAVHYSVFTGTATLTIGGTALNSSVGRADTMKQINAQLVMHEYEKF